MWQRVQTLWLLLAGALMTLLLFFPIALFIDPTGTGYVLDAIGIHNSASGQIVQSTWALFVLDAIIVLLSFVTIFLYKKRVLQIRISIFNILVIIGYIIYAGIISYRFTQAIQGSFGIKFWLAIPIISIVSLYLAVRNIGADEALVRASNRLR
ncbi:DUF4293 domain-containing protein [Porphyromonas pogonae]|uniref:DUF4293 domain-containing protein n=1 Tax=Porphyromonas pogonae TaxID=867595 RepID=UPI002E765E9C|nr:DUF4293 domain-containing protein [Porphyromonas pogonae]